MTVLTTYGLQQSIRNGWGTATLFWFDHPDGEVRFWDGPATLRYGGYDWTGVGPFISLSGIGGDEELRVRQIVFELVGTPDIAAGWLNKGITNRRGVAWIAGLDASGSRVNGEPWQIIEGRADYQEIETSNDLQCVLRLYATEPFFSIERAQNVLLTPEWINEERRLGGNRITSLDLLVGMGDRVESWAAS